MAYKHIKDPFTRKLLCDLDLLGIDYTTVHFCKFSKLGSFNISDESLGNESSSDMADKFSTNIVKKNSYYAIINYIKNKDGYPLIYKLESFRKDTDNISFGKFGYVLRALFVDKDKFKQWKEQIQKENFDDKIIELDTQLSKDFPNLNIEVDADSNDLIINGKYFKLDEGLKVTYSLYSIIKSEIEQNIKRDFEI